MSAVLSNGKKLCIVSFHSMGDGAFGANSNAATSGIKMSPRGME